MHTVTGIFPTRSDAARATEALAALQLGDDQVNILTPGSDPNAVPTATGEQPPVSGARLAA